MDFLAGSKLTPLMKSDAVKRGVPFTLPGQLLTPSATKPRTDKVEWLEYKGTRQGARVVARSSPSRARELPGATRRYATALNFKETMTIDPDMQDALKSDNPIVNQNAQIKFINDMANFREFFDTSRVNAVASVFANGAIYIDTNGNLLPNSTGAVETVGPGIATAQMLIPGAATGGDAGKYSLGDFSNASTNIAGALRGYRDSLRRLNNYTADTIIYGVNMPDYLAKNTVHKEYFARYPEIRASLVAKNEIPNGTLGFNWTPVHEMYMAVAGATPAADDTTNTWFGPNFIGIMPTIEGNWYELFEGGNLVPKGIAGPQSSMDDMLNLLDVVNGQYSFAEMTSNPVALNVHMGDSFLPVIKVVGVYAAGTCA
jgi:hypothetical protein